MLGLKALYEAAQPGECPLCGDSLPPSKTKPYRICADPICKAAYLMYWKRDKRNDS